MQPDTVKINTAPSNTAPEEKKENTLPGTRLLSADKLGVERSSAAPGETKADNEKTSYLIKSGLESETQNDIKAALWHYKKALQIEPDNLKALKNAARAAFKLKDYPFAEESARQAMKKKNGDPELIRIYAASLWKTGELEDASKAAERLTSLTKNQPDDYLLLAEISFQMKKIPAAELGYKKALEFDPACGKAAMGLARIYSVNKEKFAEGMKYYRKALDLKEKTDPELELIYPKDQPGKNGQSRLIIIKKNGDAYFICTPILYGASNPPVQEKTGFDFSAVPKTEKTKLNSETFAFLMKSGENAEKENEWEFAVWNYKKAALFNTDTPDPLLKAASILRDKLKTYGKAMELYEKVLKDFQDEPRALAALGIIYFEQGKYEKALQLLNTAVLLEPNNANIQRYQGLICLRLGNKAAAEQMLLKAFKTDPKNADIALDIAKLYTLTFKTRLNDGAKWYKTAKMLGARPDKILEGFFPEGGRKKKNGTK